MGIGSIIKGIATAGKVWKTVEAKTKALGDDVDLDGVPETQELKQKYEAIKVKAKALIPPAKELALEIKEAALIAWALLKHVKEA